MMMNEGERMNEHSLDDLIIGDPAPAGKRSKGLLSMIALGVIILLVGILLSRMILGTSDDEVTLAQDNQTEFVTPELIPVEKQSPKEPKRELSPIAKETLPTPEAKSKTVTTKPKKEATKVVQREKPKKSSVTTKPKPALSKPKTEQTTQKRVTKQPANPKALFEKGKPIYYVQVGAFNREPNPKFLKKIETAGLQYVINKNEKTRRVRVGPYGSYAEAKAALGDINSSIGIMGFVVKQKR